MVTSLDQYRRPFFLQASMRGIQNYLKEQLSSSKPKFVGEIKWEPAAIVDMDR